MPAYCAASHLKESIESILAQTFTDFEFLILDDASSDTTGEIIKHYARKNPRIVALRNEKNLGISKTRNALLAHARGEYVAWQDADDIALSHRLATQLAYMETHPEVGISGGSLLFFDGNRDLSVRRYAHHDAQLRAQVLRQSPVSQPTAIIRRSVLEKTGVFDESLPQAEDLDLSLRIGRFAKFGNVPQVLLKYRFHSDSVTTKKLRENILSTLRVRNRAVLKYGYQRSFIDHAIHAVTYFFAWLPPQFTYMVFNVLRNSRTL